MAVRQDINVGLLAFVGIVGTMLLAIIVWGLEGWYAYEVDLLNTVRYEADQNLGWIEMREEQYANIGDAIGNTTIYASAFGDAALGGTGGYRFSSQQRDTAVIPIHEAMAQIVQQLGGASVTAEQIREADRVHAAIVNELYGDYMTPTEAEPQDAPHPEPRSESAAGEGGAATRPSREQPHP